MKQFVSFFGWLAACAVVAYQLLLLVLIGLRPDLDPAWHTLSEWALGPWGWLMSLGFMLSGVGYASLAVALAPWLRRVGGRIGLVLLVVCAVGAMGVGAYTMDPISPSAIPLTPRGLAHVVFGVTQLALLPWAALVIGLSLARNRLPGSPRWLLIANSFTPLAGFLFFAVYTALFVAPLGDVHGPGVNVGWPPRLAFFCYMVWVTVTGIGTSRAAERSAGHPSMRRRDSAL